MKFCQPLRNILKNRQKIFHSMSEKDKKKHFTLPRTVPLGTYDANLTTSSKKLSTAGRNTFAQAPKLTNEAFFRKKVSAQNAPFET